MPLTKATDSRSDVEDSVGEVRRQFAVGDPIKNNLTRRFLSAPNCLRFRIAIQEYTQLGYLGYPPPVDFAIKLDGELHT